VRRGLLYAGVFYLALCAFCYSCEAAWLNDPQERQVEQMWLEISSCASLDRIAADMRAQLQEHPEKKCNRNELCVVGHLLYRVDLKERLKDVDAVRARRCPGSK